MSPQISLSEIGVLFGRTWAINKVTLDMLYGQKILLLGSNGSGKSTLLLLLANILRPSCGEIYRDKELCGDSKIGFFGSDTMLYDILTVKENLELFTLGSLRNRSLELVVSTFELEEYLETRIIDLSAGIRSKVALSRVFIADPKVVILDEPTSHLDEKGISCLNKMIDTWFDASKILIVATHDIYRLTEKFNRIIGLKRGSIYFESPATSDADIRSFYEKAVFC